ncbi:hypothetical protein ACLRDC_17050, partial [Gluconacetobacter sacchari]|uniref:hypothetical protein n=1 Tax=Gluconacetobacter sacchari TaxID=92759 RepID=UPI0039B6D867
ETTLRPSAEGRSVHQGSRDNHIMRGGSSSFRQRGQFFNSFDTMLVKWAWVRLTREDAQAMKTRTIEDAQTCLSAFLMPLDTMHGVPRLNLPAAEGVGRQNYQF